MGQKLSRWFLTPHPLPTVQELCESFKSPCELALPDRDEVLIYLDLKAHVRQELFARLYSNRSPESIVDNGDQYISEEWLTKRLSHLYPGFDNTVAAATPVLYKIILHHSTYPFKPLPNATLTPVKTAIAVALLSANDSTISITRRVDTHAFCTSRRNWNDRIRLLFQSLCDTDWSEPSSKECREKEDDEDLVAVILSLLRWQSWVWHKYRDEERLLQVASTLPSSHSRSLDGSVSLADIRVLLALIVAASVGERPKEPADMQVAVESRALALSSCFPDQDGRISWEGFQQTIADCMPLLLAELTALMSNLFRVENREDSFGYLIKYSWRVPPAIGGTESQSKISSLTMPELAQLGLVIRRQDLDDLRLLRKDDPKSLSSSDISRLFNDSPKDHTLLLWSPDERYFLSENRLSTVGMDTDCIVQLLPTHRVLRSTSELAQVKTSAVEPDDLLIDLGRIKMRFAKGLETGMLDSGSEIKSRRWLPPRKLPRSDRRFNALELPPSCPQFVSSVPSLLSEYLADGALIYNGKDNHTSGLVGAATSEDCLYLGIWTPANVTSKSKLPVLFFMSGGGFQGGGVHIPYQLPMEWVERSQSHIVVTINYRTNIFGFPNAAGLSEQNLGVLDQRMALEWVRDNIAAFGGDPTAITQWGQSAGAMSADAHAYAFYKDPIARAYFLQSGTSFSGGGVLDNTFSNFTFVAQHVGCNFTTSKSPQARTQELDCMRKVPFERISNFVGQYGDSGAAPALSFLPVVDERIIFSDYEARGKSGKIARLPAILSNTANEASSLVPFSPAGFPQDVILAVELAQFVCPTYKSTVQRNQLSVPVYRYQFAGRFPNLNPLEWTGAYHGIDIPMIFGTYDLVKGLGDVPELERETSRAIQDHVLAFAKDPYNGPQKLNWQPLDTQAPQGGQLIRFGAGGKAVQYVDGVKVDGVCQGIGEYDAFP
ncbi:alpha/beta-hydrolase [Westerdykella ornata]|uniref:Alpha/beta-hydrolase n=1 Tax=Westerdykella ornata TaxID=318751 RepID=A0A6A6JDE2_WESOR|nr:alpha/beta-hydrolase [Westerdykella ornata]KAF2274581.1 alpha/beta-hydrolase [Westerdykella ornata]